MDKKSLTETDIRTKFITPAITGPDGTKWDVMLQIREEAYFTKGRVIVRGKTVSVCIRSEPVSVLSLGRSVLLTKSSRA